MIYMLILHSTVNPGAGIIVIAQSKAVSEKVKALLDANKKKEAFNLLKRKAIPDRCVPDGERYKDLFITLNENELS